jgi:ABC-type branched-subunit amino acid transport system substrate-binding protein/tRNA A-37 threonylcarbamoyl transferase component Bud32
MQPDDQIAEWLVRWEEALLADRPPPALDQLPAELRPRASEGLRLLRGFARMSHGLTASAPAQRGAPQVPPDTPRYRFETFLGRGGMGEVWRGRDTVLAREVALKVLREQVFGDAGARARFEEEARHVSRLEHPSIVPVYDLGELPDGRPFFAMKLVHGQTLAQLLAARGTPAEDLSRWVRVFEQVCAAVAFAHARDVIHRDLKPSNVMLGGFGEVLVMDWGIAKALAARRQPAPVPPAPALLPPSAGGATTAPAGPETLPGQARGTPAFMAPEQARGEAGRVGKASDVFGLGGILCVILTGQPPYTQVEQALAADVTEAFARLDGCGADAELIGLAKACLAAAPEARPADAAEVARRVKRYREGVAARQAQAERELWLRQAAGRAEQDTWVEQVAPRRGGDAGAAGAAELPRLEQEERTGAAATRAMAAAAATAGRRPRGAGLLGILLGSVAIFAALVVGAYAAYRTIWPANEDEPDNTASEKPPIKIGFLFSESGSVSIHERPILDAAHLAVAEINRAGGVLGRQLLPITANGQSRATVFAREADWLLKEQQVEVIFGCWTSASRKLVADVCADHRRLLVFPCSYEGLETRPSVVYLGGAPNQTVIPLIDYAYRALGKRRFFHVGSPDVYSYALQKIFEHEIENNKDRPGAGMVGFRSLPAADLRAVDAVVGAIKEQMEGDSEGTLFVISSIDGTPNEILCKAMRRAGISSSKVPTAWLSVSEPELALFHAEQIVGDYTVACYFESLPMPSNRAFIERLRQRLPNLRVNDAMETTYAGVYLWKEAAEATGGLRTSAVREALRGRSVKAPEGPIRIDSTNLHAWRTPRIGQVELLEQRSGRAGGAQLQFKVVKEYPGPVRPEPFPTWMSHEDWDLFLNKLYRSWGKSWEKR